MSDVDFDADLDNDNEDVDNDKQENGPKALRDQVKKLNRELAAARKEADELKSAQRTNDLTRLLEAKGAKAKLAKYAARDLDDVTEESVSKWLEEEGELFGWAPPTDTDDSDDDNDVDAGAAAAQQQISKASASAPPPPTGWTPDRIKNMSPEQLIAAGLLQPK